MQAFTLSAPGLFLTPPEGLSLAWNTLSPEPGTAINTPSSAGFINHNAQLKATDTPLFSLPPPRPPL